MRITIFTLIIASCLFYGCDKCRYVEPANVYSASIEITYKDKLTKNFLITKGNSDYKPEDYKITYQDGSEVDYKFLSMRSTSVPYIEYYVLNITGFAKPNHNQGTKTCRTLFIDYKNDRDTVNLCYKIKDTKCGGTVFEDFTMHYNGQLIDTKSSMNETVIIEK